MLSSKSFKSKTTLTGKNPADFNTKDVEIAVTLKDLSYFLGTLKMSLVICEINLNLRWSVEKQNLKQNL